MPTTARLALPSPASTDAPDGPTQIGALATALDNAAMYEQGAIGSIPAGTARPNGYWYADTATGARVWINVGTGGSRTYRSLATGVEFDALAATYKRITGTYGGDQGATTGTRILRQGSTGGSPVVAPDVFYLDLADYAITGKATKYRVRAVLDTNQVAPATTFTIGLYPVTLVAGASGAPDTYTLGTVVAGSTVAFASPAASTPGQADSGDFAAPAAGRYCLAVLLSGTAATGAWQTIQAYVQVRQV